jgi:hypothetical protein
MIRDKLKDNPLLSFQGAIDLIFPCKMSPCMFVLTSICFWLILPFILASVDDSVPAGQTTLSGQYIIFIFAVESSAKHHKPLCPIQLYLTKFFSNLRPVLRFPPSMKLAPTKLPDKMNCSGFDGADKNVYVRQNAGLLSLINNWLYALKAFANWYS